MIFLYFVFSGRAVYEHTYIERDFFRLMEKSSMQPRCGDFFKL